ncbi:MAG: ABC transporter ATP-binding protein [Sphaerochaetaceae bacterium]
MEAKLLDVKNLNVSIGKTHILKDVSFSVSKGEVVALIGANGAGKTTTLESVMGFNKTQSGSVLFHKGEQETDITNMATEKIVSCGLSLCPEGRQIFASLSVHENIVIGSYLRKNNAEVKRDQDYVFSLFPILYKRQNQKAGSLSGGEQMMLAVGRSLMSKPTLLLLDEPSLGLAPLMVEKIFSLLQQIHKDGTSILLVEQNAAKALDIADRVYVLEVGRVAMSGTGTEMKNNKEVQKAYLGIV